MTKEVPQFSKPKEVWTHSSDMHMFDTLRFEAIPDGLRAVLETFGTRPDYPPRFGRDYYFSGRRLPDGSWEGVYLHQPLKIDTFPQGTRDALIAKYTPAGVNRRGKGYNFYLTTGKVQIGEGGKIVSVTMNPDDRLKYGNIIEEPEEEEGFTIKQGTRRGKREYHRSLTAWSVVEFGFLHDLYRAGLIDYDQYHAVKPQRSWDKKSSPLILPKNSK